MLSAEMRSDLIKGLCDIFKDNILTIILYGSVARNEANSESDIDIAFVIKESMDDVTRDKFINWVAEMDLRYDLVFSIVDIQNDNLKKWGNVLPFYKNVQNEGIVLWKAA